MFFNRLLKVLRPFCVLATCDVSMVASPAFAVPTERVVTAEDFAETKVYSPYAGRAYSDRVF